MSLALRLEEQFYNDVSIDVDEKDVRLFIANLLQLKDIDEALSASNLTYMDLLNFNKYASYRSLIDSIISYLADINAFAKIRAVREAYEYAINEIRNGSKNAASLANNLIKSDIKQVINISEFPQLNDSGQPPVKKNLSDIIENKN